MLVGIGAGLAALGAIVAVREARWRRLIGSELPSEVVLGILTERDLEALRSWKRFRGGWLAGSRERRAFCRIAGRLARAKATQRRGAGEAGRLLQVQVLTLRTRLREILADRRAAASAADDILSAP
jgi:hypothetical protein